MIDIGRFQYESIQPISTDPFNNDHGGGKSRSHNHNGFVIESDNNNQSSANVHPFTEELFIENSLQYLGSEWFHHEIELFREFNKVCRGCWLCFSHFKTLTELKKIFSSFREKAIQKFTKIFFSIFPKNFFPLFF